LGDGTLSLVDMPLNLFPKPTPACSAFEHSANQKLHPVLQLWQQIYSEDSASLQKVQL
jgi:hypothetical protein